jgi:hypothetical protein
VAKSIEDAIRDAGISDDDAAIAKRFTGYQGVSSVSTRTRLYLNEQLNEYFEIATVDVIKTVDLGGDNSPFVLMLVKPDAVIKHTAIVSEDASADFLAGEIATQNLQDDRILWHHDCGVEPDAGSLSRCTPPPR